MKDLVPQHLGDGVYLFLFSCISDLKDCFYDIHLKYEQQKLNSKLEGINFPFSFYMENHCLNNETLVYCHNVMMGLKSPKYVIAAVYNDKSTILHEYCHAVYYLDLCYRKHVEEMWSSLEKRVRKSIEKDLEMRGYRMDVYLDEFQAYLVEDLVGFGKRWREVLLPIRNGFRLYVNLPSFE